MADGQEARSQPGAGEERRGVLNLRYERAQTNYANVAVLTCTPEEVVLNFGINVNPPTPRREVNVEVTNRVVMSYPSAKRLAITLSSIIQRYEAQHGVIQLPRPEVAPPDTGARGRETDA